MTSNHRLGNKGGRGGACPSNLWTEGAAPLQLWRDTNLREKNWPRRKCFKMKSASLRVPTNCYLVDFDRIARRIHHCFLLVSHSARCGVRRNYQRVRAFHEGAPSLAGGAPSPAGMAPSGTGRRGAVTGWRGVVTDRGAPSLARRAPLLAGGAPSPARGMATGRRGVVTGLRGQLLAVLFLSVLEQRDAQQCSWGLSGVR